MPNLLYNAEPLENLQARFRAALEKVWIVDPTQLEDPNRDRPGLHREHTFDFMDGTRLMISRDLYPEESRKVMKLDGPVIHISASWVSLGDGNDLNRKVSKVPGQYHLLGGKGKPVYLGLSQGLVPHFIVRSEQ